MDALLQDLRYAIRTLRKSPGFTAVVVATLALGTGANAAMFQLLNTVEWRTVPVADPHRLIEVRVDDMTHARGSWLREQSLTTPIWERLRAEHDAVTSFAAWADEKLDVSTGGESHDATVLWVSGEFFPVLGVRAVRGRLLEEADDRRGCGSSAVVLSYGFWQQHFGGDSGIIGRPAAIGRMHPMIVGVTPSSFTGLEVGRTFDIAAPICAEPAWHGVNARLESGMVWWLTVIGRLRPRATFEQAASVLRAKSPGLFEATLPPNYPPASIAPYRAMRLIVMPAGYGLSRLRMRYELSLRLLLAITTVVLLIACLNLAHLTRARTVGRHNELAVRLSLGASPLRITRQLMAETTLLTMAGVALGAMVARTVCRVLISLLAADGTRVLLALSPDWRTFGFMALVAVAAIVIAGSIPARDVVRIPPIAALTLGRQPSTSADSLWTRRTLLAAQIALSLVLLVAAAMFVRTLRNLETLSPGFQPRDVVVADVSFSDLQLPTAQMIAVRQDLLQRLRLSPAVAAASEALILPVTGGNWNSRMWIDGSDRNAAAPVMRNMIGTDYFRTLGTSLLAGRDFSESDMIAGAAKVAIVNEQFTRRFALGADAVRRHFRIETNPLEPEVSYEIVGVVSNTKYHDLREQDQPIAYVPLSPAARRRSSGQFLVRAAASGDGTTAAIRSALDAGRVRYSLRLYDDVVRNTLVRERLMAAVAIPFGILAGLLSAIGLYAVFSDAMARRRQEIGIRIALGATRRDIIGAFLRETALVVLIGVVPGAALAFAASRAASSLLFGVTGHDAATLFAAAGSLALVAVVATYLPARRAARVDPIAALRAE